MLFKVMEHFTLPALLITIQSLKTADMQVEFKMLDSNMMVEAMEDESGIKFNGNYISNLRYADDAALVSESKKKLQKMLDKLSSSCLDYGW